MTLQEATDAFVDGWGSTRRLSGPFEARPIGNAQLLFDPRGTRVSEFIAVDRPPEELVNDFPKDHRGAICALYSPNFVLEGQKRLFKNLGWRLLRTEPMFFHDLKNLPPLDPRIVRASSPDHVARICKAARMRPQTMGIEDIDDAPIRLYEASVEDQNIGWVRSIRTTANAAWVSSLNVRESHRRQGYGAGLMAALLHDDHRLGRTASVLLASHTGALLYPRLGYQPLGTLMLYMPKKTTGNAE